MGHVVAQIYRVKKRQCAASKKRGLVFTFEIEEDDWAIDLAGFGTSRDVACQCNSCGGECLMSNKYKGKIGTVNQTGRVRIQRTDYDLKVKWPSDGGCAFWITVSVDTRVI